MDDHALSSLPPAEVYAAVPARWGEVVRASEGRAERVALRGRPGYPEDPEWPVAGHARDLSPVAQGDRVIVLLDCEAGAVYLTHCLAAPGEPPRSGIERLPGGMFLCRAEGGAIRLEVDGAQLELCADGRILLDGEAIRSRARGEHRIRGARVAIN